MGKRKSSLKNGMITLCVVVFFNLYIIPHIRFSVTPSAGAHLFWKKNSCTYTRWETVSVRVKKDDPFVPDPEHTLLIKHIACLPGELIVRKGKCFYCGNIFAGCAKERARDGRKLKLWYVKKMVIPEGYFFLSNPMCADSYDSRYLGLFSKKDIVECLEPIW